MKGTIRLLRNEEWTINFVFADAHPQSGNEWNHFAANVNAPPFLS
jgi:hypothetical protein